MRRIWVCRVPQLTPRRLRPLAHALRDRVLGEVLGEDCRWAPDARGKPQVLHPRGWHMSLSHSRDAVALMLAEQPAGIDIEPRVRKARWAALARRQFHADECAQLEAQAASGFASAALALWTAKEAWAKASGEGVVGMARAPSLRWQDGRWALPAGHADSLQQFVLWDEMVVSVYLMHSAAQALDWVCLSARAQDGAWCFEPTLPCPVAEFRA